MSTKNINGEIINGDPGLREDIAAGLEGTLCMDFRLFDHLDLNAHAFKTNEEAHNFFFKAMGALNAVAKLDGFADFDSLSIYRVANYKNWSQFELFGDQIAFDNRALYKADTTGKDGKEQLTIPGPDGRRIIVSGNNVQIVQPDGNVINSIIA